jgi:ribonuclease P protein component
VATAGFSLLIKKGKRLHSARLVACFAGGDVSFGGPALGISIPKRHVKSAVLRNAVKRQIREAYRLSNAKTNGPLMIMCKLPIVAPVAGKSAMKHGIRAEAETLIRAAGRQG